MRRSTRGIAALLTAAAVAASATACANIGASDGADRSVSGTVAVGAKACSKYGKSVTLTMGVSEAGQSIAEQDRQLARQFEKKYPNVTVNVQVKDFADSLKTIKLAMSGSNPPDLMQGNEGWAIDGALWKAGLIKDLSAYEKAYDWGTKFPETALAANRFTADGATFGTGKLTGLPQGVQYVGVFYNKKLLTKLGVTDPSTLDDRDTLLATVAKAKSAKLTPVMLGDSEKNWALHNLSLFNGWYVSPDDITKWVYGTKGSTYDDAGHVRAATEFQSWMTKGYFNSDALSTSFNDAEARFAKNQAAFFVTGTWALGDLTRKMGDNVGFMLWPAGSGGKHAAVGGYSLPYTMSSKTKYPDCAAALLNFVTAGPEAVRAQIASGRPSATTAGAKAHVGDPLLAQMVADYTKLNAEKGLFPWEDWPTPTMLTLAESQAQLLLSGKTTPKAYCVALQKNWDDYLKSK